MNQLLAEDDLSEQIDKEETFGRLCDCSSVTSDRLGSTV